MDDITPPAKRRKMSDATEEVEAVNGGSETPANDSTFVGKLDEVAPAVAVTTATTTAVSVEPEPQTGFLSAPAAAPTAQTLSKSQLKKLRKREEWEASRDFRKAKRKEKNQERKVRKREQKAQEREERIQQGLALDPVQTNARQRHVRLPVTFLIDCGFDDKMLEKERISLGAQLTRSYSDNHKAPFQAHMYISSWGGLLKERFDTVLSKHYENWRGIVLDTSDFVAVAKKAGAAMKGPRGGKLLGVFDKYSAPNGIGARPVKQPSVEINGAEGAEKQREDDRKNQTEAQTGDQPGQASEDLKKQGELIYLSSDSPYILTELKPYSTYVIGGLVDKNRHKGICYKTACDRGIRTAKLPIGQYMEMQSRFVLATNHVVEIMLRWLECGDWGESFMKVIPKRKGGKLRAEDEDIAVNNDEVPDLGDGDISSSDDIRNDDDDADDRNADDDIHEPPVESAQEDI